MVLCVWKQGETIRAASPRSEPFEPKADRRDEGDDTIMGEEVKREGRGQKENTPEGVSSV